MPKNATFYNSPDMPFGDRLRKARLAKGLTQEGISQILGIKQQRYQPWEAGRAGKQIEPPHHMMEQIANILEVSVEWLITGKAETINEAPSKYGNVTDKIIKNLCELDEATRHDVLKYIEEKRLISSMMKKKKGAKNAS